MWGEESILKIMKKWKVFFCLLMEIIVFTRKCHVWRELQCLFFFCFFYIEERRIDVLKDQLDIERDPNLEVNKDIFIFDDREQHKRGIVEEKDDYKGKVHALGWELKKKEKEYLI